MSRVPISPKCYCRSRLKSAEVSALIIWAVLAMTLKSKSDFQLTTNFGLKELSQFFLNGRLTPKTPKKQLKKVKVGSKETKI